MGSDERAGSATLFLLVLNRYRIDIAGDIDSELVFSEVVTPAAVGKKVDRPSPGGQKNVNRAATG
ncbi:MAG TPA: hypothetical protein VHU61_08830 [Solirubrobacteraceae bacterium]|nr:hypothetical protein [Solirubrobacteraceae bacterium]